MMAMMMMQLYSVVCHVYVALQSCLTIRILSALQMLLLMTAVTISATVTDDVCAGTDDDDDDDEHAFVTLSLSAAAELIRNSVSICCGTCIRDSVIVRG